MKAKISYIILGIILLAGLFVRLHHIDYPTIGYHNMKEDEFLSFAINMHNTGNPMKTIWFDCDMAGNEYYDDPYEACAFNEGEAPISVWLLILFFSIFGWKLWVARMMIILFTLAATVMIYFIAKKLIPEERFALLAAGFFALLPLSIFFGRNIQMDSPALFLGLVALYFLLIWNETKQRKHLLIALGFIVLTAWFKITTLVVLFPLLFVFDYKHIISNYKKMWLDFTLIIIAAILAVSWLLFFAGFFMPDTNIDKMSSGGAFGQHNWVDLSGSFFSATYWHDYGPILTSYVSDNFSMLGFYAILIGFLLFWFTRRTVAAKFMFGYAIGIIIYLTLFAYKANAHNYYQFPMLPFAAFALSNVFFQLGAIAHQLYSKPFMKYVPLVLLLLFITPFTQSTMQQFNTQFFGQDLAGQFIHDNTQLGDMILLERGGQNEMSWTAQRFYYGIPQNTSTLQELEQKNPPKYIVLTYYGIQTAQQKESWTHIAENYRITQVGFIQTGQGPQMYHIILEKGGTFNISEIATIPPIVAATYDVNGQNIDYYTITRQ